MSIDARHGILKQKHFDMMCLLERITNSTVRIIHWSDEGVDRRATVQTYGYRFRCQPQKPNDRLGDASVILRIVGQGPERYGWARLFFPGLVAGTTRTRLWPEPRKVVMNAEEAQLVAADSSEEVDEKGVGGSIQ